MQILDDAIVETHGNRPVPGGQWLPDGGMAAIRQMLEELPVPIWVKDLSGKYRFANNSCGRLFGMSISYIVGRSDADCHAVLDPARTRLLDERVLSQGRLSVDEQSFCAVPGKTLTARVTRIPVNNGATTTGVVAFANLRPAQPEEPSVGQRILGQQIARVAHEIRTPVGGVIGLARLLASDACLGKRQSDMAASIVSAGEHLLALANDMLDIGRARSGGLRLEFLPVDIAELVGSVARWLEPRVKAKGLQWQADIALSPPAVFASDPQRLRQVLLNLLGNAVRHTSQGSVTLRVRELDRPKGGGIDAPRRCVFEVIDTGEGVPLDLQAELFKPYVQRTKPISGGGAGLGLAISHELVRAMGGELKFESRPGHGSRFFFDIEDRPQS